MGRKGALEADAGQQPHGFGTGGGDIETAATIHGGDSDGVAGIERIWDTRELKGAGDTGAANGLRCGPGDGRSGKSHLAGKGGEPPGHDIEERGLAGAV